MVVLKCTSVTSGTCVVQVFLGHVGHTFKSEFIFVDCFHSINFKGLTFLVNIYFWTDHRKVQDTLEDEDLIKSSPSSFSAILDDPDVSRDRSDKIQIKFGVLTSSDWTRRELTFRIRNSEVTKRQNFLSRAIEGDRHNSSFLVL